MLEVDKQSIIGAGSALNVLPLPGKVIAVREGKRNVYRDTAAAIFLKGATWIGQSPPRTEDPQIVAQIGPHHIFVFTADSEAELVGKVEGYVRKKYQEKAKPAISMEMRKIVRSYIDRGYKHFAFDLIETSPALKRKHTIVYEFESEFLYYPLAISAVGGQGDTVVSLAVITAAEVTKYRGLRPEQIRATTKVNLTSDELATLDKDLARLMEGSKASGRIWQVQGKLESFGVDIECK